MNKIDRLIQRVKKIQRAVHKILFYRDGICELCHKNMDKCSCGSAYGDDLIINFVRCRKREEAMGCRNEKD